MISVVFPWLFGERLGTKKALMSRNGPQDHMTKEQATDVKVGDVILVGMGKDRPAVVNAIYHRGISPPYFGTTVESGFTSWRLAALPQGPPGQAAA
jgi:hypothetical protein